jgi:putative acyl-CoA dehydrogenase
MARDSAATEDQPPPYADVDLFTSDRPLRDSLAANGVNAPAATEALASFGRAWGDAALMEQARLANDNPPVLVHDVVSGDRVDFHPAYHRFMHESMTSGLHTMTWRADGQIAPPPAEVARAARFYMVAQIENGHMCPITMTRASVAALAAAPAMLATLMPKIAARTYDPRFVPWWEKHSITIGMGMTEKQGGSDVRANTTRAARIGDDYEVTGHKWFMSAPMCDAFLVLAQAEGGLTCFFMPRFRPDGAINALHFVQLKNKLGNRSNASSEVTFDRAYAVRVGDEGRGIRTILQMVQLTRLDCAVSSAGIMRMALAQALHHARHRVAFQKTLVDHTVMRGVLADMALEVEGAVAAVMRLCRSFDLAGAEQREAMRARILTPALKYWICKRAPAFVYEAMECVGGNGYVEDSVLPRLYREAPVNAIWEGSGNIMALDVLRAANSAGARDVIEELVRETASVPGAAQAAQTIGGGLGAGVDDERARQRVELLATISVVAALNSLNPDLAAAFARTRLLHSQGRTYGYADVTLSEQRLLIERALPA